MTFADQEEIHTPLRVFGSYAGHVWRGGIQAQKNSDFTELVTLSMKWLDNETHSLLFELLCLLVRKGVNVSELIDNLVAPMMRRVGQAYLQGEFSIGEEHRITYLVRDILVQLGPLVRSHSPFEGNEPIERCAILGCARSQEHELGALMARLVLENLGWEVIYLGLDVPTEEFARQQIHYQASLVCIALMPPMNKSEAIHIVELLDYMYNRKYPYHLILGGPIQLEIEGDTHLAPSIPSVKHFSEMQEFASWVTKISAHPLPSSSYATSKERPSNSLNRSFL